MIPEYLLAKIEKSDVIYRCIGNEMKNGILACGFMRKETADRSQYHFSNEYYSCFVLLRGAGNILPRTAPPIRCRREVWSSVCLVCRIPHA